MADAVRAASAEKGEYTRWRDRVLRAARKTTAKPNPAALEASVMALARSHPEYVVMGA